VVVDPFSSQLSILSVSNNELFFRVIRTLLPPSLEVSSRKRYLRNDSVLEYPLVGYFRDRIVTVGIRAWLSPCFGRKLCEFARADAERVHELRVSTTSPLTVIQ
jgi:hypothetical protein